MSRVGCGKAKALRLGVDVIPGLGEAPQSAYLAGPDEALSSERVRTVLDTARQAGMLAPKTARISGRISPALIEQAKRRTGMESDTDVIEFALASVALDDPFVDVFQQVRGTVDPDIELGF